MGAWHQDKIGRLTVGRNIILTLVLTLRVESWSNELVVIQSPTGKNVNTEADDIIGIRHQTTTDENIAN
jgi:hypothetical protein